MEAVGHIARAHAEEPVCLYLGSLPATTAAWARKAMLKGERYVPLSPASFMPLVAVLWPRHKAEHFLRWSASYKCTRADDHNAAQWVRRTKQRVMVSVPSLVQHDASLPSVKGLNNKGSWCSALFVSEDGSEFLSADASDR